MQPDDVNRTGFADDADTDTDTDADFAGEHDDTTFADEEPGGPERAEEPESPRGRDGQD
jgi:hypothetical protein